MLHEGVEDSSELALRELAADGKVRQATDAEAFLDHGDQRLDRIHDRRAGLDDVDVLAVAAQGR
jgi:hypothetical protein